MGRKATEEMVSLCVALLFLSPVLIYYLMSSYRHFGIHKYCAIRLSLAITENGMVFFAFRMRHF